MHMNKYLIYRKQILRFRERNLCLQKNTKKNSIFIYKNPNHDLKQDNLKQSQKN